MILKFFRSQTPVVIIIFIFITILPWIGMFFLKTDNCISFENEAILFSYCFSWLKEYRIISLLISFLCILLQSLWLNSIIVNADITARGTQIPGLIYFILMCGNANVMSFNGVVFSVFFIIYNLKIAFELYNKENTYIEVFKMAFSISIAALFYLPMLFFYIFIWLVFFVYRNISFRSILISIVGFILPVLYLFFFYFWFDKIPLLIEVLKHNYNQLYIHDFDLRIYLQLIPTVLAFIYLYSLISIFRKINSRIIRIRKYIYIIIWLFVLLLIISLVFIDYHLISFSLLSIPATVLVTDLLLGFKRKWLAELLLFMMIILFIIDNVF